MENTDILLTQGFLKMETSVVEIVTVVPRVFHLYQYCNYVCLV